MIEQKHIEEYKRIYHEEYGCDIANQKALEELTALVCLLGAVERHINSPGQKNGG